MYDGYIQVYCQARVIELYLRLLPFTSFKTKGFLFSFFLVAVCQSIIDLRFIFCTSEDELLVIPRYLGDFNDQIPLSSLISRLE